MPDAEATDALTHEPALATAPTERPQPPGSPATIGRFRILGELGRGGMGVVYEAHDDRLDRRVAVKVVDLHRVGTRGRARALREARALARLSHPNVVQVFEVGEAPTVNPEANPEANPKHGRAGAPLYLAMEHVEGSTLREWCRAVPRRWPEVLAVYRQAAEGLAAAHDKGLVHRDFKPDNAIIGANGRVRVLDFGLARAQDGEGSEADVRATEGSGVDTITEDGAVLGTPAYMAPEQFLGGRVDARTDQFALCVSLFEALYGHRPYEGRTRLALFDAVTQGRMRPLPAEHDDPPWVIAALRRGLRPEPSERFPDMRALLRALEPPRWRGGLLALGLATAAVIGGLAWSTTHDAAPCSDTAAQWQAVWSDERREAVAQALGRAPVPYAEHARTHVLEALDAYGTAWIAERTAACTASHSGAAGSSPIMERRVACLASARRRFDALVDVLAEADAGVVGHAVAAVAELPAVARCAEPSPALRRAEGSADPEAAARVEALREQLDVAIAWHDAGRLAGARERIEAVLEGARALDHRPLLAEARLWLGLVQDAQGEHAAAVESLRAAFFDARAVDLGEVAVRAATHLIFEEGYRLERHDEAEAWAEHARAMLERLGDDALEPALHMAVANAALARGRYEDARAGYERAVAGMTAQLGPTHPRVARALSNLANAEYYLGNLEAAAAIDLRVLQLGREALGPSHPDVSRTSFNLGSIYFAMKRYDEALARFEESLEIDLATLGPLHPNIASTRANIALAHGRSGDLPRALAEQRELLRLVQQLEGDDTLQVASVLGNMAGTLSELGRHEEAAQDLRRALAIVEREQPADHPEVARSLHNLALVENELGQHDAALEHCRRALEIRERSLPPLHFDRSSSTMLLSDILESRGELSAAREAAARAVEIRERGVVPSPGDLGNARIKLARLTWETGGDRAHARALAEGARDAFAAAGDAWREEHERAVRWLEDHP